MIKILDETYINEMIDIACIKTRISGIEYNRSLQGAKEHFTILFTSFYNGSENFKTFGYFKNDKLISFITLGFFENSTFGKFYVIAGMHSNQFKNFFSFDNVEFGQLLAECINYAEKLDYNTYYYSVGKRVARVYNRQFSKNPYLDSTSYQLETIAEIPPNTKPDTLLYWRLMGKEIIDDVVYIKRRTRILQT